MLVKDPEKRYSIEQIKKHRWLLADGIPRPIQGFSRSGTGSGLVEEYSEHVLRLMETLGIEKQKTIEVNYNIFLVFVGLRITTSSLWVLRVRTR